MTSRTELVASTPHYAYDPALNQWDLLATLPANRSTSIAGVIGPNQIISVTGNGPDATSTVWIGTFA